MGQPIPQHQIDTGLGAQGMPGAPTHPARGIVRQMALKVPAITAFFWIAKLLSTALGESTSDYLVFHFVSPYVAVALGAVFFIATLLLQLFVRRYIAWVYWLAVTMVAVFGTMAADVLHVVILAPRLGDKRAYLVATVFFAVCLVVVFATWYLTERTLSIHSIDTTRRELFYWAAVVTTFALGTAAGDMTAFTLNLGFFTSALLYIALFELPALGYFLFKLNPIVAFWFAYIITRPLGASFADWFGKPKPGGLGFGDGPVSLVLGILIVAVVAYMAISRKDMEPAAARQQN